MKALSYVVLLTFSLVLLFGCGGGTSATLPPPSSSVTFTSMPPSNATESQTYSYTITASATGAGGITYQLASAPTGATLSGSTLTWAPTPAQVRIANSFSLVAQAGTATAHQNWTVTPSGTVHGSQINTYATDAGDVQQPDDASQMTIAAMFPDGNGGFSTRNGAGAGDGTYSIPSVAGGKYWLAVDTSPYVWTRSTPGRTDRAEAI